MNTTQTNQVITFVPNNKKPITIERRNFTLLVLNQNLLKIIFTDLKEKDKNFTVRCIDALNLYEVIQISFFDNNESMEIENIEVYIEDEAIIENDRVSQSLVPIFKNIVDPHTDNFDEDFTLTLYSLDDTQYVINNKDIKSINFDSDNIYITIIANDKLYRIIASNCRYIYPILEDSVVVNPRNINIEGIIVITCTLEEFRKDSFKYTLEAQVFE